MFRVTTATTSTQLEAARALIEEYGRSLGIDLEFQAFGHELASFPGDYATPGGCVLIAEDVGCVAGCVCLHQIEPGVCEMKRLYVIPEYRGHGVGRALAQALIDQARAMQYTRMRLDTLAGMSEARAMYQSLGFRKCDPYRINPLPGASFMELVL